MKINDQPGRYFAILIFAPFLIYKSCLYNDKSLLFLGILLFTWDLYWIINNPPKSI